MIRKNAFQALACADAPTGQQHPLLAGAQLGDVVRHRVEYVDAFLRPFRREVTSALAGKIDELLAISALRSLKWRKGPCVLDSQPAGPFILGQIKQIRRQRFVDNRA